MGLASFARCGGALRLPRLDAFCHKQQQRCIYGTITTINGLCRIIQCCANAYNRCFAYCRDVDLCTRLDTADVDHHSRAGAASLRRCAARMSSKLTGQVCAGYPFACQLLLLVKIDQLAPRQLCEVCRVPLTLIIRPKWLCCMQRDGRSSAVQVGRCIKHTSGVSKQSRTSQRQVGPAWSC